jgi:hypothetical protein
VQREASQQPAGGASGRASSSSSASFPPCQDSGAPREIPSAGGGSDVPRVVREFGISKICASTAVIVDPLASLPSSPPLDMRRALLAVAAPAATVPIATGAGPRQTRGKQQAEAVAEVVNDGDGNRGGGGGGGGSGGDSGGGRQQRGQAKINNKWQHFEFI